MKFFLFFFSTLLFADPTPKYLPEFKATMYVDIQKNIPADFAPGKLENCKLITSATSEYEDFTCKVTDCKMTWKDADARTVTVNFHTALIFYSKKSKTYHFSFTGKIDPIAPEYKDLPNYILRLTNTVDAPKLLFGNITALGMNAPIKAEITGLVN
jgi:hypothetical protein